VSQLTFYAPDHARFRCLGLAIDSLRMGGLAPTVLNAANEIAVEAFLAGRIGFLEIPRVVEETLNAAERANADESTLDGVLAADARARSHAGEFCRRIA
jgi:1-deoxy-D-xylulose-5-phosphate reductoisomerase